MKLKFLFVFVAAFVLIFAVLNSRFIYANLKFWLEGGTAHERNSPPKTESVQKGQLPDGATLIIDGIGVRTPIIFGVGDNVKNVYKNLENGVVHHSGTPKPGMNGVSIILGHSSAYPWYKGAYGSVFALLGKLKAGDKIYVKYSDGRTFVFSVKQSIIFSPFKENPQLTQIEKSEKPTLVLISCWPIGTNYKRIAVQSELE
jgi:LPXTG-site transpeptidase (sortase) family protein